MPACCSGSAGRPSALAGTSGAGVAVARQAYTAELPQHQQHHKGPGAAQLRAPGHGDAAPGAVQHPSKTGSSSWPRDVPVNALAASELARGSRDQPLRSSFFNKNLRSGDTLIPQGLLAGVLLWLGWQAQRIGWNVWGRGSCCPPGLHCRTAPAPAAPQRPRRSTAPARRAMGMLHPVQYNTQVKQAVAAGQNPGPRCPVTQQASTGFAAQQFFQQNLRSGDTLIPQGLLAGVLLWLGWQAQRIGWNVWGRGSCCPPGLHCRTAPAPAAPQRPRRSTAPARRAMGMLHPVQYNTQVKQAVAAGRTVSDSQLMRWPASRPAAAGGIAGSPLRSSFFNKTYAAAIR